MIEEWDDFIVPLYRQEYDKMFRVAYRLCGSAETAKDLIQDTFLLALFHVKELTEHPKPAAWLMITLTNLIKNENRRMENRNLSIDTLFHLPASAPPTKLDELLPISLSPQDRQVLIWRFEQQLDYREIANRLGISEAGCRSRISRAVAKCRRLIE